MHLQDPVEVVLRRGRRLGRARRSPLLGAAAAAALVAAALVLGLPGTAPPSAFAAWTPTARALAPGDTSAIATSCQIGTPLLPPRAVSAVRGDFAFTLFTDGTRAVSCGRYQHGGSWREGGSSSREVNQRQHVRNGDTPVSLEAAGDLTVGDDHPASVWGWASTGVTALSSQPITPPRKQRSPPVSSPPGGPTLAHSALAAAAPLTTTPAPPCAPLRSPPADR